MNNEKSVALIISPLNALISNQVAAIERHGMKVWVLGNQGNYSDEIYWQMNVWFFVHRNSYSEQWFGARNCEFRSFQVQLELQVNHEMELEVNLVIPMNYFDNKQNPLQNFVIHFVSSIDMSYIDKIGVFFGRKLTINYC